MNLIKFDDNYVSKGKMLLKCYDNIKAANDYYDAGQVINMYNQFGQYNKSNAKLLDGKLRKDYPEIDILDTISLNLRTLPRSTSESLSTEVHTPVEIRNLQFDQFGILFSVLRKQNSNLKEVDFMHGLI